MVENLPEPTGCTCFKLRKLARATSRLYDQHMARTGLKTTQYSLLKNVAREALPIAALADVLGLERTTLTRNLRPLQESGWVTLEPGADSRQRIVTISSAGRAKLRQAAAAWRAAQDQLNAILGVDLVRTMHDQLDAAFATLHPYLEEQDHATD